MKYGAGPSGIHVREAAHDAAAAAGLLERALGGLDHRPVQILEAVPGDGRLEGLADHAAGDERVAQVRRAQEDLPPGADRVLAIGRGAAPAPHRSPVVRGQLQRPVHPRLHGMIRRLEPEHEQRAVLRSAGEGRLARVEQAAVRRVEAALPERADSLGTLREVPERDSGRRLVGRAVLQAHPRLRDHAEDALGADQHPIRARARAGARQPPRLDRSRRGDGGDRLDEVVDVGVEGREMPAGAGGDPAAQGRELERLREVAQGQAVLAQLVLQLRAGRAGLDQRRP